MPKKQYYEHILPDTDPLFLISTGIHRNLASTFKTNSNYANI